MDSPPSLPAAQQPPARHDEPSLSSTSLSGGKRPAPSLLPAFEPLSSSPGLPRPLKRQNTGKPSLPTPVPTSSTGILFSSSPPQHASRRRGLQARLSAAASASPTVAAVSERVPLSAVPAVELSDSGETVFLGRSSNSSHVQLSANRLISRVHVLARYIPAAAAGGAKIEIVCNGWNGLKLHCQGRTWELFKGDSFTSETECADVMVDVLDARVMIQWPRRSGVGGDNVAASLSDSSSWDDSPPSSHAPASHSLLIQSSPLRRSTRIASPESPTPASTGRMPMSSSQRLQQSLLLPPGGHLRDQEGIQIYEDDSDVEPELPSPASPSPAAVANLNVGASMRTEATASFSSETLSDGEDHNPDEENDPIIHSFGPFGADISGRMASIMSKSPKAMATKAAARRHARNASLGDSLTTFSGADNATPSSPRNKRSSASSIETVAAPSPAAEAAETPSSPEGPLSSPPPCPSPMMDPVIANHVVNQLAFSRLSSTPLSTIVQHLPAESRAVGLDHDALREAIESTACIGIIRREGKDAAGKALESEYYYIPEHDDDEQRRAAVVDGLRKPSLRACRKQHKQYYWKRPRTP
ncbi:transcription factor tos4 [Hirsutella rhossiliensis]|uniref:Transcription factor tos4 n=1 Tax=Hirsutella rhossiliensis TaxID=111463 RepID=A0A9P8MVP6_9HYPO|nr:transcription factor tos4 [Hirsutella rhossiliensis]KAH0961106.1 transcription factor tos4 [Hirsutella rhossiliensis]